MDGRGAVLGEHHGLANYTVGQRRGLGLASGRALYVTALDSERNALVVGRADEVEVECFWAEQVNLISRPTLAEPLSVSVKIRHTHTPAPATIRVAGGDAAGGDLVEVRFDAAQRAVAPGQSAVFYQGELVVGGGVITARRPQGT